MQYSEMSKEELLTLQAELNQQYAEAKAKGLNLDMSRGKPSATQLNVSLGLLDAINASSDLRQKTEQTVEIMVYQTEFRKLKS